MNALRAIQAASLLGLGIGLCLGDRPAVAGSDCPQDGQCSFKKPALLIVLDASSSMNAEVVAGQTRWEAAVELIEHLVTTDGGFFDENMNLAVLRYGHDPDPSTPGTTIPLDPSGLIDGVALDVHWYDPVGDPDGWLGCSGAQIVAALQALPPPLCSGIGCTGIEPETGRAMEVARALVQSTRADHPNDVVPGDVRRFDVLLVTQGQWVPAGGDPAVVSAAMYDEDEVHTWVTVFDDPAARAWGDPIAFAGGTSEALVAVDGTVDAALEDIVDEVASSVVIPECTHVSPRVMVVQDASSEMLNVGGIAGAPGQTPWDQARELLSGTASIFDAPVPGVGSFPIEDLVHAGLVVYGGDDPAEERLLVQYGACLNDNLGWALDPSTSCGAGCIDPWAGPPIDWTFMGPGDPFYPGFDTPTFSHMPACDVGPVAGACDGSSAFVHRGLELVDANLHAYQAAPPPGVPVTADTPFVNVLVVGRSYAGASTDAQVENALTHLFAADGVTTFVLAVSDAVPPDELADLACWGSGGSGQPCTGGSTSAFDLRSQGELEAALAAIVAASPFDPCCAFPDCSFTGGDDWGIGSSSDGGGSSSIGNGDTEGASTDSDSGASESGPLDPTRSADATGPGADTGPADATGDDTTSSSTPDPSASGSASATTASPPGTTDPQPGTTGATETDGATGQLVRDTCACTERDAEAPRTAWLWLAALAALRRRRAITAALPSGPRAHRADRAAATPRGGARSEAARRRRPRA